jgi:PDZ domain
MQQELLGNERGIYITNVAPTGSAGMVLEIHDVLLSIDKVSVTNDGTIIVNDQYEPCKNITDMYEKVPFWHYIRMKHPDDQVELTFLRDGEKHTKKCTLQIEDPLVPRMDLRISNEYYVIGGLVFLPLNYWHVYPNPNDKNTPASYFVWKRNLLPYLFDKYKEFDDQQIVILSEIVPGPITAGYDLINYRLHSVNGEEVKNIKHLQKICDKAEGNVRFEFDYNTIALVNITDAKRDQKEILNRLGIAN